MDRFQPISQSENLCFLCLQPASNICDKCSIPYCNQEHYKVHYNADTDYCYPFRVLQKPEVIMSNYVLVPRVIMDIFSHVFIICTSNVVIHECEARVNTTLRVQIMNTSEKISIITRDTRT